MSNVKHNTATVNGTEIFYREAGQKGKPALVLLHGYPTSSHMYRNLLADLADEYYLIAPDFPGFGRSAQPHMADFEYSFRNYAILIQELLTQLGLEKYSLYLMDYGAPVGFRIATAHPEKIQSLIVQNGCAYEEGLEQFWDPIKAYWNNKNDKVTERVLEGFHSPEGLQWQYTHGVADTATVSPDNWELDLRHLQRPGNDRIQLQLFYDYQTNVALYPQWQQYFRTYNPEMLIVYGKNDYIFPVAGAEAYKKDVKNLQYHLFDTGHFALETHGKEIAATIREFLHQKVK
ncbi:Pimeloyl-ACP methyl ester carboxylesterase [Chitinophaga jiangningensis]|uniref:Pimeloyl-ACP methyl ester carboxylesterase n=1 Tax=Chitinophaga jiangningensis TaxID=1419482 RepID=A0A1M7A6N3_9BACT|nr:alpha/beta hydrolase [Chitinophaga jiangningensis]SHL38259.1 Pimeloyl-ACP methyl ester carboxylesterase [Chitinophaga jiangningensis]